MFPLYHHSIHGLYRISSYYELYKKIETYFLRLSHSLYSLVTSVLFIVYILTREWNFQVWVPNKKHVNIIACLRRCDAVCIGTDVPAPRYNVTPLSSERTSSHQEHKYHTSARHVATITTERSRSIRLLPPYSFSLRSSEVLRRGRWIVGDRRFGTVCQSQIQGTGIPKMITSSLFFFQALNFLWLKVLAFSTTSFHFPRSWTQAIQFWIFFYRHKTSSI